MDKALASAIAHRWHPVAAPVSDENVHRLLQRLDLPPEGRVLDLGCGFGEWLLRLLERVPDARGVGVDTSGPALRQARESAARRRLPDRVRLMEADAPSWTDDDRSGQARFDAVLCVGATRAFGGAKPTLTAVRRHLRPGGRVLLGDGFWEGAPDRAALDALGARPGELPDLAGLVGATRGAGFEPGYGHVSTAAEWDDYEWSWTGALAEWALTEAPASDRAAALALARSHRDDWLAGYRNRLGFLTVVLQDVGRTAPDRGGGDCSEEWGPEASAIEGRSGSTAAGDGT